MTKDIKRYLWHIYICKRTIFCPIGLQTGTSGAAAVPPTTQAFLDQFHVGVWNTCCRWNPCVFNDIANVNVYAILMVFTILMVYVLHDIANTNCFSNVHAILPVLYYLLKPPCLPGSGGKVARRVQSISSYWRPVVNCFINLSVAIASSMYSQTSQAQKHQAIWKQTRPRDGSIPGETHCHKATVWTWFIAPT